MAGNPLVDYATEHEVSTQVTGHAPHGFLCAPFGLVDSPGHLFPANEYSRLSLKITGESGAGTVRIVGQQLRR